MKLKIMHTGDVHLGKKFNNYPSLSEELEQARYQALENVVKQADKRGCQLLVVAGDLFDKPNLPEENIIKAVDILSKFSGECILILPGNHDYNKIDTWEQVSKHLTGRMLLLMEGQKYDLQKFDLDVAVYPAPCDDKHSEKNVLSWIPADRENLDRKFEIGIAHGALSGVSPDLTDAYFKMSKEELRKLNMDLWLLGHSHISYPERAEVVNQQIFNSGTPEPDGLDCSHPGYAWYIEIDNNKNTKAERMITGNYIFVDRSYLVNGEEDLADMVEEICDENAENKVVRIVINGRIKEELYRGKNDYFQRIKNNTAYARIIDENLNLKITKDKISEEFTPESLPHEILQELMDDEEALQMAYEFIQEVKN